MNELEETNQMLRECRSANMDLVDEAFDLKKEISKLNEENRILKAEIMICAKALADIADSHDNPENDRIARDALGTVPKQYSVRLKSMEVVVEAARDLVTKSSDEKKGIDCMDIYILESALSALDTLSVKEKHE